MIDKSAFDGEAFASMTLTDPMDTKYTPVPAKECAGVIKDLKTRVEDGKDGGTFMLLDVIWTVNDAEARAVTGQDEPIVRQSIFLDTTEQGGLDAGKGKNVKLGKLRDAVGLNTPGQPFNLNMLKGRPGLLKITHRIYKGDPFAEVDSVAPLR